MFKKMAYLAAIVAVLILGANDGVWAQNLILNGDFENPAVGGEGSAADNWIGREGSQYYGRLDTANWDVYAGTYSFHLGDFEWSEIYQNFTAVADQLYLLDFQASGWPGHNGLTPGDPQEFWLGVGRQDHGTWYIDETVDTPTGSDYLPGGDLGWTQHRRLFQPVAGDEDLVLFFINYPNSAISLDDVSVTAVEELVWQSTGVDGNWGDATRWLPTQTVFPNAAHTARLDVGNADIVTVESPHEVLRLTVDGGGIAVGDQSLSVVCDTNFAAGTSLSIGAGGIFSTGGGGQIDALSTAGGASLSTGGQLDVTTFTAAAGTFTKQGLGQLTAASFTADPATILQIEGGTLQLSGADPVDGVTDIQLAGGTLSVGPRAGEGPELIDFGDFEDPTFTEGGDATWWIKDGSYGLHSGAGSGGAHSGSWRYAPGYGANDTLGVYQPLAALLQAGKEIYAVLLGCSLGCRQ